MEQRDLIKDQIEQLGKVLAKMLSNFLGLADKNISEGIEQTNQQFKSELNIDIEKILVLKEKELRNYLQSLKLQEGHLETISRYFEEIGNREIDSGKTKSSNYLVKAIELLAIANEISNTISLDRINKMSELKDRLKHKN